MVVGWGACIVVGGHAWLWGGGMCGCGGHAWLPGGCVGYDEIQSKSGRYASYWNAFLFTVHFPCSANHVNFGVELKACLHVMSLSPSSSISSSKFNIVSIVTDTLIGRMGCRPIMLVKVSVKIKKKKI